MSIRIRQVIFSLGLLCLLSCESNPPLEEEALVAQLQHVDSTVIRAENQLGAEVIMPLPASTEDTIIVHLQQERGWGPFEGSLGLQGSFLAKKNREFDPRTISRSENDPWPMVRERVTGIPDSLSDVRIVQDAMQLEQAVYHGYKNGLMDEAFALSWFRERKVPAYLTDEFVDQWVSMLIGEYDGHPVVVFDTNNDESFEGEQAIVYPKMPSDFTLLSKEGWDALPIVPVAYEYYDGSFIQEGTAYMKVNPYLDSFRDARSSMGSMLVKRANKMLQETLTSYSARDVMVSTSQHWKGEFAVDGHTYHIALSNSDYGGMYKGDPLRGRVKAIIDSTMTDTMAHQEEENRAFGIGEPIVLRGDTFHVADVTMYGDVMILVRGSVNNENENPPYEGQQARNFEATTLVGDLFNLFEFLGKEQKYVLLDFWGSWCGPCLVDLPKLESIHNTYGDRLHIIGIALDDEEALMSAIEEHNLPWPQIRQASMAGPILKEYHIFSYPSYFLIGPDSVIIGTNAELRSKDLNEAVGELLR